MRNGRACRRPKASQKCACEGLEWLLKSNTRLYVDRQMNTQTVSEVFDRYGFLQTIVCCPITKGPLKLVGIDELLSRLSDVERERLPKGAIGAFMSEGHRRAYPVTDTVANFLEQNSIAIQSDSIATVGAPTVLGDDIKQSVKAWYDQFGWKKNDSGTYNDTALFSQNIPEGHGFYELMSHLSILDRLAGGEFILDAASGAITHPEYLGYSWFYKRRICVDMSETALIEAHCKLRQSDFCCLADICHLPFRDAVFGGAVSGYTIQHIPESQQLTAVKELYRVLKPNAHLCVLTDVPRSARGRGLRLILRVVCKLLQMLRLISPLPNSSNSNENPLHALYFHPPTLAWWNSAARDLTNSYSVESLRLLSKSEFDGFFGQSNRAARVLRSIECLFPRLMACVSRYCLIDLQKTTRQQSIGENGP